MKNWGLIGLGLAIAGIIYFSVNKAKQAIIDGLNFVSAKITAPQLSLNQINHTVKLRYLNSGPVVLWFDSFIGGLYYGEYLLSTLSIPNRVSLPPNAETDVNVSAVIRYGDFLGNILALIENKQYLNSLSVRGTVVIGGIQVPVNYPLQLI